jgi:hypothetical protein
VTRATTALAALLAAAGLLTACGGSQRHGATVTVDAGRVLNEFRPDRALGAGLDGHSQGDTRQIYTAANARAMRSAGLAPISYRLRTELGVEAWHWSPSGRFSAGDRGYWTSAGKGAAATYGYRLPRRGDSVDQANDDGYSRLDDGDPRTFWKSNPYLDEHFTHETHPQWALIDLRHTQPVDAIRIDWGAPYATRFEVQYWVGPSAIALNGHPPGTWASFGSWRGRGGRQTLRLARRPRSVRFVRVLLSASSHTAPPGSRDVRDRLGYAIRELYLGRLQARGFADLVRHSPRGPRQTITYVSSTDPWHTAAGIDHGVEQPGFTTILRSGLTNGLPMLVPVPVLYGTPADALAELRYLRRLHVPLRGVELGEEPDGQLSSPEDYGALYVQYARAIHREFPGLPLGGPGFQTSIPDWLAWPDARGNRSWTGRFIGYLRSHGALGELAFYSFEWYPFDNTCAAPGPQLARSASTLATVVRAQFADGLPRTIPLVITEYGYSAFAGQAEVDLPGALLNADVAAGFLALGGQSEYLYGYEPDTLIRELPSCNTWGNLTLLLSDGERHVRHQLPTYWAARLLTQQWTQPGDGAHRMLAARTSGVDPRLLGAYAVRRPDGRTALLLLNKDPSRPLGVTLHGLPGTLDVYSYGPAQYAWQADGEHGHPIRELPPVQSEQRGNGLVLAPFSLTVVRTR